MKLTPPFPLTEIGQGFGQNADPKYGELDLAGHPGIDFGGPTFFGTPIPNTIEGAIVSAILSKDNPNLEAYRAVNTIVDGGDGFFYEIQYGHVNNIIVKVGDVLKLGQEVATVGNTGDVYTVTNGVAHLVTDAQKQAGSHAGAHLHYQVRQCVQVPQNTVQKPGEYYLNNGVGGLVLNGFKYRVLDWNNGFNGCVNPMQFFLPGHQFAHDLYQGTTGAEVVQLQQRLGVITTGYFGALTFKAVKAYQTTHGLPSTGYVGPLTRAKLNGG